MNRRLSKFEIWLRTLESFEIHIVLTILLSFIILFALLAVIPYGLNKEVQREDVKIIQYQESIK